MTKTLETAESYTELEFPFDITKPNSGNGVRLYDAIGDKVFGIAWYGDTIETAWSIMTYVWLGNGLWSAEGTQRGVSDHMHLPVLPVFIAKEIDRLEGEARDIRDRLAAHPDAPQAWRAGDERILKHIESQIAKMSPQPESEAEEPPAAPGGEV